jgi:hypothetical protein
MILNPPHAIRPGTAFRDGKLYEFYRDGIIALSRWPDMRAWRRTPTRNGPWRISELKVAKNQEAMSITQENVESWLGNRAVPKNLSVIDAVECH